MTSRDGGGRVPAYWRRRATGARRPRIFLHIGEPKTGTTFLQHVVWGNRQRLAAQGVLLPGYTRRDHSRASRDLRETPRVPSDPADPWLGEWDVLTGQALRAPDAAVISDEILAACNPPQADRAVRSLLAAEVHVVLTVRDFAAALPAEWQERIKCRSTERWDEWLAGVVEAAPAADRRARSWFWTVHDTLAILDMWSRHIPPDHVHVITMPRPGQPGALWERFASVLGVDSSGFDLTQGRANFSLGPAEAEFLRQMNEAMPASVPYWFYTRNIKRILAHDILSTREASHGWTLPGGHEAWAREQSEVLVAGLRESKYDVIGDLGELVARPATGSHAGPSDQPPDQLLAVAVHAAANLADVHYRQIFPPRQRQQRLSPRQTIGRIRWTVLNGRRTKRILRNASHRPVVRRLRVLAWCALVHPARHRRRARPEPGAGRSHW